PARTREGRAAAPARPHVPGARRGGEPRHDPRRPACRRSGPAHRPRGRERRLSVVRVLQRAPTAERPGPGPMPDALLRALDITIGRRIESLLAGDYRSTLHGDGTELAQVRPYVPGDDVRLIDWNVTARTLEPPGRLHLAERVLG